MVNIAVFKTALAMIVGFGVLASGSHTTSAETLSVVVDGVRSSRGSVLIAVHDQATSFPSRWQDAVKVSRVPAGRSPVSASFSGLRKGRYAVVILHDEDGNGEMTTKPSGFPAEGFGTSNNPAFLGPPTFEPAAVEVSGSVRISITLRYP